MLATAAVVSVALPASEAWALALGRVNVQSALGEPLRAEVEIPQITAAEAEGLRVGVASPGVFRTLGMEYNATASQVRVSVQRPRMARPCCASQAHSPSTNPLSIW